MHTHQCSNLNWKDPLVSRLSAFLSSSSHNSDNFCLICKNFALKLKMKLSFLQTKYISSIDISSFEVEQRLRKVVYFFGTPVWTCFRCRHA